MPCNKPYTVYQSRDRKTKKGKPAIEFKKSHGIPGSESQIACGQCYGCRMEHSRKWAYRNMHEAQLHQYNQYITLTYNDENIPYQGTLHKPDIQKFWKRLRKHQAIRYYSCGEYGDEKERPHYHAIVFNLCLIDKVYYKTAPSGDKLYKSKYLEKIWKLGNVIIGESVTFESCAYVSRYILKKWKAKTKYELDKHYERTNKSTGLVYQLEPEFQTMSRRPGIGTGYYEKYKTDMYQHGTDGKIVIRGGISCSTPSFYDQKFEAESSTNSKRLEHIKEERKRLSELRADDNTPARLKTKESIAHHRATRQLPRNLNK